MNLAELVGFDYPQAIRKLNQVYTYDQITKRIGYENKASLTGIMNGAIPSHIHGEALWALYLETFDEKPQFIVRKQTPYLLTSG